MSNDRPQHHFIISLVGAQEGATCEWNPVGDEVRTEWYADGTVFINGEVVEDWD